MLVTAVTNDPDRAPRHGMQPLAEYRAMPPHQQWLMRAVERTAVDEEVAAPEGSNGFLLR
jgi:hypothetical protein